MYKLTQETTWPFCFVISFDDDVLMRDRPVETHVSDSSPQDQVCKYRTVNRQATLLVFMVAAANEKLAAAAAKVKSPNLDSPMP